LSLSFFFLSKIWIFTIIYHYYQSCHLVKFSDLY
jgi:hypothetical protein